jgi:hypothetical protein
MTLVETLVAVSLFSLAVITTLQLYQEANRTWLTTAAATIQQQNARFALDRMAETIRDAGAGTNVAGDEQIEGAWDSAILVRGDELAGYVLRPGANGAGVPPYRLARLTYDKNGKPQYDVIAENVVELSFRYLDADGKKVPAVGDDESWRETRARIRTIEVELTTTTTRKPKRTFTLSQAIVPPSLGKKAKAHAAALPVNPKPPASITACAGHCKRYLVSWLPSVTPGVTTYMLDVSATGYHQSFLVAGLSYQFAEPEGAKRTFTFKVASMSGTTPGAWSPAVTRSSANPPASTPRNVENVNAAAVEGVNALRVTWSPVTSNTGVVTENLCSDGSAPPPPWNASAVDLSGARISRTRTGGATVELTGGERSFVDRTAAPCSAYTYKVKACDVCGVTSPAFSAEATGRYTVAEGVVPEKPVVTLEGKTLRWAQAAVAHYVLERWRRTGAAYALDQELHVHDANEATVDTIAGDRWMVKAVYDCDVPRVSPPSEPLEVK